MDDECGFGVCPVGFGAVTYSVLVAADSISYLHAINGAGRQKRKGYQCGFGMAGLGAGIHFGWVAAHSMSIA